MDSKLPKPSGLKRPAAIAILPMDRIKAAVPAFGSKSALGSASAAASSFAPLTRDLTNFSIGITRRDRAVSPDISRSNVMQTRVRLRRSRSACDIRDMRSNLKRTDNTFAPIPNKTARLMSSTSTGAISRPYKTGLNATTAGTAASTTAVTRNRGIIPTAPRIAGTVNRVGASSSITKKGGNAGGGSTSTTVSTTGAGKPINKRIPPYDYKARYNDLLEKYKVIKDKLDEKSEQINSYESLPEQLEESQAQLYATQEQLKIAKTDIECLNDQVKLQSRKLESVTDCLVKTKDELDQLKQEHTKIKTEHSELSIEVVELRSRTAHLTERNAELEEEMLACKEQLFRSNMERKELHNTVLDLRGNIRVFCRVRPPLDCEMDKLQCGWNYIDEATLEIQNPDLIGKNKTGQHMFSFDQVFHPCSRQEDIFEMVSPLIQSALDGYNICIFAYGQTGSGKTYTMDGISSYPGVIPRTVDLLFDSVVNYKRLGWAYDIKVTFLEIYNEVLYDLLSNDQKEMEIRMAKNNKNDVYVSNITQETVTTAARLRQLMQLATMNRATASTAGNERSSRSHAVTKIELIGRHAEKNEMSIGSINLVDLAGSESPKTSIRMNETKNINRSLSELTNVILALLQKQDHIPYRNSKLTHLLMPSLGGNSKTLMFINVAPFLDCFVESVKSLRFAASVNSCKMAKAKRNRFLNTSESNSSVEK